MQINDTVRIRPGGATVFTITDIDDEGRPIIEPVEDAPGRYAFPMRPGDLMPA